MQMYVNMHEIIPFLLHNVTSQPQRLRVLWEAKPVRSIQIREKTLEDTRQNSETRMKEEGTS